MCEEKDKTKESEEGELDFETAWILFIASRKQ